MVCPLRIKTKQNTPKSNEQGANHGSLFSCFQKVLVFVGGGAADAPLAAFRGKAGRQAGI